MMQDITLNDVRPARGSRGIVVPRLVKWKKLSRPPAEAAGDEAAIQRLSSALPPGVAALTG